MFNIIEKSIIWADRELKLQTGKIARQSDGAVMVSYGDTVILCTVVANKEVKEGIDFLPLTVVYQEKAFAVGKFPGGFFKRETKPSEREVLISRLIDRSIRPLFPENYHFETQVICTVLSYDSKCESDIPALIGTAAALRVSGIPFNGPVSAAKVGYIDGNFVLNPDASQLALSDLDLVVAGTHDSVLMVESEAKELSEAVMLDAVKFGHESFQPIIDMINSLPQKPVPYGLSIEEKDDMELEILVKNFAGEKLIKAFSETAKQKRQKMLAEIAKETIQHFESLEFDIFNVGKVFKHLESKIVRDMIITSNKRIDGRKPDEIRPINVEVGLLPRTHGSSLFTRGETQALVATTLGTTQDEQIVDTIDNPDFREHFTLHYNFPPFSVGEASPLRAPGRREIGHGKLAWRALHPVMPSKESFPYAIRLVSEITESNGSSSMATVCGSSLALMDAGVPIKCPVSGIAMGLIMDKGSFVILSDIMGDEDHLGDMDFKVAGTEEGVTALQMDIKVTGITFDIMEKALKQAKEGRAHIISEMNKVINTPRVEISKHAPTITKITIPKDKIREVIGQGGKTIREICEVSGTKIEIEDNGTVSIASNNAKSKDDAINMIKAIIEDLEVGKIYKGKVVKIVDFGAFVNFMGTKDGLVHISEIRQGERLESVSSVLSEGQSVWAKVMGYDKGKMKLSMKMVDQTTGLEINS